MSPQPCPFETGLSISFGDRLWRVGGPPTLRAELVNLETALSIWRVGGGALVHLDRPVHLEGWGAPALVHLESAPVHLEGCGGAASSQQFPRV